MAFKIGLTSITFRNLPPEDIIDLAISANIEGIEWGGDIHVPHGDIERAREVAAKTTQSGLCTCSYGSYYRVGKSEKEGLRFEDVLKTASELKTNIIRVWAGAKGSKQTDKEEFNEIIKECCRIGQMALDNGVKVCFEWHSRTLTDTDESAIKLLDMIKCPAIRTYWQPRIDETAHENLQSIEKILNQLEHVHVFHWGDSAKKRFSLKTGERDWLNYLTGISHTQRDHWFLIEFVKDNSKSQFMEDINTLKTWINSLG